MIALAFLQSEATYESDSARSQAYDVCMTRAIDWQSKYTRVAHAALSCPGSLAES